MRKKTFPPMLLLPLFVLSSLLSIAQQKVTGRVVAGDSVPAGATIQVKGAAIFTKTDETGSFSIHAPAGATLARLVIQSRKNKFEQ